MKLGLISDIHSNYRAFKACLDYFEKEGTDCYLLLGDYVSDTAYPEYTMQLLYELREKHKCIIVRGNREDYFINHEENPVGWKKGSASGNLLYTREHLTGEDIDFFKTLPLVDTFRQEGYPSITICHGSPLSAREHIYPVLSTDYNSMAKKARAYGSGETAEAGNADYRQINNPSDADGWLKAIDTDILVSGHTHHRCIYEKNGRTYVNLGSCGISIGNAGMAECALFTGVETDRASTGKYAWDIQLLSIPYDVEGAIQDIYESGLYDMGHWFINSNIQTLSSGIDHASDMVIRANEIYAALKQENNGTDLEKCYEQASKELGIRDYQPGIQLTYIRMATMEDAERLVEIYAPYVTDTAVTFECEVPSAAEFRNRIQEKLVKYPYYVAVQNGKIIGYAYASNFHTRAAYAMDVELSIYVDRQYRHCGIGSLLLSALEEMLRRRGFVNLYSVIAGSDLSDDPYITDESLRFHKKHGYIEEGCLKKCGLKFGRWYDIHYLSKRFVK